VKRALLMLAALPFLILGGVALVVGIGVLVPGCMLWPPSRSAGEKESGASRLPWMPPPTLWRPPTHVQKPWKES